MNPSTERLRVLATDRAAPELAEAFSGELDVRVAHWKDVTQSDLDWANVYVGFRLPPDLTVDHLQWVHGTGAGVDGLIGNRRWPENLPLTRTPGTLGLRMAEYCLAHILGELQRLGYYEAAQTRPRWARELPESIGGRRIVFLGGGEMVQPLARFFRSLGASTIALTRSGQACSAFGEVRTFADRGEALSAAHWIIVALPAGTETYRLLNREVLSEVRGAALLNIGRGSTVDEEALLWALDQGHVRRAILDVFEIEPLPDTSPLWKHPKISVTPHVAGLTDPAEVVVAFRENLARLMQGAPLLRRVDPLRGY